MREDLLYRLNVFPIALPPLRERGDDIALIATSFLQDLGRQEGGTKHLTPGALARLQAHRWPGNVRELRNVVQRAWVMAAGDQIDEEWLPSGNGPGWDAWAEPEPAHGRPLAPPPPGVHRNGAAAMRPDAGENQIVVEVGTQLAEVERRVILATYERCGRHKERTAALLGISMKTLYNRLKEYQQ